MEPLKGYDAAYALRGWRDGGKPDAPREVTAHDPETLRTQVEAFMTEGGHGYVELAAWSFELNDWVRMEAFDRVPDAQAVIQSLRCRPAR